MISKTASAGQHVNDSISIGMGSAAIAYPWWQVLTGSYEIMIAIGGITVLALTIWNKWYEHLRLKAVLKQMENPDK